jgi:hypothetical protein
MAVVHFLPPVVLQNHRIVGKFQGKKSKICHGIILKRKIIFNDQMLNIIISWVFYHFSTPYSHRLFVRAPCYLFLCSPTPLLLLLLVTSNGRRRQQDDEQQQAPSHLVLVNDLTGAAPAPPPGDLLPGAVG